MKMMITFTTPTVFTVRGLMTMSSVLVLFFSTYETMISCLHNLSKRCKRLRNPQEMVKKALAPFRKTVGLYCDYFWEVSMGLDG